MRSPGDLIFLNRFLIFESVGAKRLDMVGTAFFQKAADGSASNTSGAHPILTGQAA
ncbi:hypothetical protein [Devosia sp. SD17-2]|uniref:hypothetical protein n=1 Tax=Devosia sp. SD17-2 TaxID=2976459 RepID=UPI0023D89568|nr:hypothetical protein [Devosia sp. SD17-2]WEJ34075.1 hypothetical protein NYQ88_04480 [Devosia sp. SD17-2]